MPNSKILVVNGPNLNLLGDRQNNIYGEISLVEVNNRLKEISSQNNMSIEFFQSNHEGAIIDKIQAAKNENIDGLIINLGAFTHYSYAILDALSAVNIPYVEIHISNISNREEFRTKSLFSKHAIGVIYGFGSIGYNYALMAIIDYLQNIKNQHNVK